MAALKDALAYRARQMTLAEIIQHESEMAERLILPAADPLTSDELALIDLFQTWCVQRKVRALPVRPEILANFIKELAHRGEEYVQSMTKAIGRCHTMLPSLSDPTASRAVHFVLDQIIAPVDPPRSWTKDEKLEFASLPRKTQATVARREREREAGLRRSQNALAEELKKIQTQTQTSTKETTMATVKGKFSQDDDLNLKQVRIKDNAKGRDISKAVEGNTDSVTETLGPVSSGNWNKK
jgi:hypothetical protein